MTPESRKVLSLAAVALISVWTVSCGDGGSTAPAPAPNRAPVPSGSLPAVTVSVGMTESVNAAGYFTDPDGDALAYSATSSNDAVATVSVSGSVVTVAAVAQGEATITVTARDPGGLSAQLAFAVTVPNREPVAVGAVPAQTVIAGDTVSVDITAYFSDPDGDALTHTAASSDAGVATVAVAGDSVTVVGVAAGDAMVTVTATDPGGLSVQQRFPVGVAKRQLVPAVVDSIPDLTLALGEERTWKGYDHFNDPDGDTLTFAAGSSNAAVALAVASGSDFSVAALSLGAATVTITASDPGGRSAKFSFRVTVRPAVAIARVEPEVLVEGASARITGAGFAANAADNRVAVGGVAATVTSASETSLSFVVPRSDCLPPRRARLEVVVGNSADSRTVGVTPRSREDIDVPAGHYKYTFKGNGCLHLPGGEYLIGVVSTAENAGSLTEVTMTSAPGDPTVLADAAAAARVQPHAQRAASVEVFPAGSAPTLTAAAPRVAGSMPSQDTLAPPRDWGRHADMMARNQELVRRLGRPPAPSGPAPARSVAQGDTVSLFADFSDHSCTSTTRTRVQAVVRLTGNHTVWLEDIENPAGGFTDSELAELDAFYASDVKPVHDAYYGGLSDVDGDRRLWILMTKEVNREDDEDVFVGGWVWFGDLYPSTACATSNHREVFYGRVPDPAGVFGSAWDRESTLDYYPSLLTHEVTHLVQAAAYVFGAAQSATWELEGGATLAEQLVAYRLFGHGSDREMGHAEYQEGSAWYGEWVRGLARFFGWDSDAGSGRVANAPEQCSWVGRPEEGNSGPCRVPFRAAYDVPSMVYRYALDRWGGDYPGGETALMRRLTQSARGFGALEDASSWRIENILADFYITLWLDLNGGRAYGMTTWNLRDIWRRFGRDLQLLPYTSSSARFTGRWSIRAGSSSFLHWTPTGSRVPAAIKAASSSGGATPEEISVWAYRIR